MEKRKIGFERELGPPKLLDMSLSPEEKKELVEKTIEDIFAEYLRDWEATHPGKDFFGEIKEEAKKITVLLKFPYLLIAPFRRMLLRHYMWQVIKKGYPGLAEDEKVAKACIAKKVDGFVSKMEKAAALKKR